MENRAQGIRLMAACEAIKEALSAEGVEVSASRPIEHGVQFSLAGAGLAGVVRVYDSRKGPRVDCSQLKGASVARVRSAIEGSAKRPGDAPEVVVELPAIGTDESGKGDYFGPLVAAGVYVDEVSAQRLAGAGVRDSKTLSDSKALALYPEILEACGGRVAVVELTPERYNALYEEMKREGKNLNTLLAWGHAKAIEEVLSKVDCGVAIADQFANERFIKGKLQEKGRRIRLVQMPRAEAHIAVAAASVVARARFLRRLELLSEEYGVKLPKGASSAVVEAARRLVRLRGPASLRGAAKLHFKTTDEVLKGG
jgi:ribonuclease HIII